MDNPPIRRKFPWKVVGIAAGVLAAALLAALLWVRSITADRWARVRTALEAEVKKERDRDARRPVLRGTPVPGNAWDDYRRIPAELLKIPGRAKLYDLVARAPKSDPADAAAPLELAGPVLELLAQGATKDSSTYGFDWEKGISAAIPGLMDMNQVASLAVLKARALQAEGRHRDAAALLLDAAQAGRDTASEGPLIMAMIGLRALEYTVDGLRELIPAADAGTLADLDRALALLDRGFPVYAASLRREHLAMSWSLVAGNEDLEGLYRGFGYQLVYLKAYDKTQEYLERSTRASGRSWSESLSTSKEIQREAAESWNPITKMVVPGLDTVERIFRERLAQLRLLRAAVQYRQTGDAPDLDDPFGAKLLFSRSDGALKVWSVGPDGADHGGKGEWKSSPGPDIVLETKK